jgi:hypothetical protein
VLASSVEQITACESSSPTSYLPVAQASLQIHVYQPTDGDAAEGFSTGPSGDGEEITAASVCELPSRQWEGLWDSLIFPDDTKSGLLDYIYATVLFSDANVDCEFKFTTSAHCHNCIQSTLSRGTGSYSCMARQEQERLHSAGLSHRNSLSDCRTGMEIRSTFSPQGLQLYFAGILNLVYWRLTRTRFFHAGSPSQGNWYKSCFRVSWSLSRTRTRS